MEKSFVIESGTMRATDPCYKCYSPGLQAEFPVLNGTWNAFVFLEKAYWCGGNTISSLLVKHEEAPAYIPDYQFQSINDGCGVDSGQFGFFDAAKYPTDESEFKWIHGSGNFYSTCCEGTTNDNARVLEAAVLPFGACSATAYGDGSYKVEVAKNAEGVIIAARVIYLDDEEDDYYIEEDEDEYENDDDDDEDQDAEDSIS